MIFYGKDTGDGSMLTCSRRLYCDCWCSFTAHMQPQYRTKFGVYLSQQCNSWWVDSVRFSKDSDIQVLMYIRITNITIDSLTLICSHNDKQVWNLVIIVTVDGTTLETARINATIMVTNVCTMTITVSMMKTLCWRAVLCKMTFHFDSLLEGVFNIHFINAIHRSVLLYCQVQNEQSTDKAPVQCWKQVRLQQCCASSLCW